MKKYKSGFYVDQCFDIAIIHEDGDAELLSYSGEWLKAPLKHGYYFDPIEYLCDLSLKQTNREKNEK
jgi:hypothetical protein